MHIIGLIAEYNPFHNGHLYQINKIKEMYPDSLLVVVLSSCFTQRGNISILDKWTKTEIALTNGIDIVIELPFVFATQSSDIFAKGAVKTLEKLKIDTLVFGTESSNIDIIKKAADIQINNKEYDNLVKEYISSGINYPTATNKAIEQLLGYKIDSPNDLLALSYIKQIMLDKENIDIINIPRTISYHGTNIENNITSASNIRNMYYNNQNIDNLIPYNKDKLLKISIDDYLPYLKYISSVEDLSIYQTVDEGIENRIQKEINEANTYEELIQKIKTKRYTYNKISRMILHILTKFTKEEASNLGIEYIRVLGFTKEGQKYLSKIKKEIDVPIITGYKKGISRILDIEFRVTKIYSLLAGKKQIIKEYENKPIIK